MSKPNIPDAKTTEKVSVSEVEIQEFVNSNIVPLERKEVNGKKVLKNSVCVDGRTEPEDSKGRVHMFGGDSALLLSFVATLNEEAIEKYNDEIIYALIDAKKEIEREDAKLCLHTDKHGKKAGTIGCGHANRASSNKEEHNGDGKYGLT